MISFSRVLVHLVKRFWTSASTLVLLTTPRLANAFAISLPVAGRSSKTNFEARCCLRSASSESLWMEILIASLFAWVAVCAAITRSFHRLRMPFPYWSIQQVVTTQTQRMGPHIPVSIGSVHQTLGISECSGQIGPHGRCSAVVVSSKFHPVVWYQIAIIYRSRSYGSGLGLRGPLGLWYACKCRDSLRDRWDCSGGFVERHTKCTNSNSLLTRADNTGFSLLLVIIHSLIVVGSLVTGLPYRRTGLPVRMYCPTKTDQSKMVLHGHRVQQSSVSVPSDQKHVNSPILTY